MFFDKALSLTVIISILIFSGLSSSGLYAVSGVNTTSFTCIKSSGKTQISFYLPHSILSDSSQLFKLVNEVTKAKSMGFTTQVVYMICREVSPSIIVQKLDSYFKTITGVIILDRYWVTPHDLTTACGWTQKYTMAQNCQYMQEFMEEMYRNNLPVGITSNTETWNTIFGSTCNNIFSKETLYWFPFPTIDDDSTLNAFVPFGGWATAQMKVFSCPKFCNLDMTSYFCNQIFE